MINENAEIKKGPGDYSNSDEPYDWFVQVYHDGNSGTVANVEWTLAAKHDSESDNAQNTLYSGDIIRVHANFWQMQSEPTADYDELHVGALAQNDSDPWPNLPGGGDQALTQEKLESCLYRITGDSEQTPQIFCTGAVYATDNLMEYTGDFNRIAWWQFTFNPDPNSDLVFDTFEFVYGDPPKGKSKPTYVSTGKRPGK